MHTDARGTNKLDVARAGSPNDWAWLLRPSGAYARPGDVLRDDDLTVAEKRAILASWASDASAVVSNPSMRKPSTVMRPIPVDEILEALRSLDTEAEVSPWHWPPKEPNRPSATRSRR